MLQNRLTINCAYRKSVYQYCAAFLGRIPKQHSLAATRRFPGNSNLPFQLRPNQQCKSNAHTAKSKRPINNQTNVSGAGGGSPSSMYGYLILRRSYCTGKSTTTSAAVKEVGKQLLTVRKQHSHTRNELKRLFSLAKDEKWYLIGAIGCLVISSSVAMGVPYAIGKILDMIVMDDFPQEKLQGFCLILSAVFVAGSLANFGRIYLMNNASK